MTRGHVEYRQSASRVDARSHVAVIPRVQVASGMLLTLLSKWGEIAKWRRESLRSLHYRAAFQIKMHPAQLRERAVTLRWTTRRFRNPMFPEAGRQCSWPCASGITLSDELSDIMVPVWARDTIWWSAQGRFLSLHAAHTS